MDLIAAIHDNQILGRVCLQNPLEHYRYCRSLFLGPNTSQEKIVHALRSPYAQIYQPSIAVASLLSNQLGLCMPPVIPRLLPSGAPCGMCVDRKDDGSLLSIPIAEELASHWMELGFIEEGKKVQTWASKFQGCARRLYYPEALFLQEEVPFCLPQEESAADPYLGLLSRSSGEMDAAITLTGSNSALGAVRLKEVMIPAFGPQTGPLSEPLGFGVSQLYAHGAVICIEKGQSVIEGWTRCQGCKESWLHLKAEIYENSLALHLRPVSSEALKIAFFIQAACCSLPSSGIILQSKTLKRYQGKVEPLLLNDSVRLECQRPDQEFQIIPLAGKDCFWNSDFLIAFTCPLTEKISFTLQKLDYE